MLRDLELLPRVEEQRNKKDVNIPIIEFDLNEIKSHFDDNIKNIEKNFEIVDKMASNNEVEKSKNILRSQIVFLESALDFYLHEISKYAMIKIFKDEWPKTDRYKNLKVEMRLVEDAINNPESYEWLLNYINERNKREVYISLESMKDQLNLLGIEFNNVIDTAFSNKYNNEGQLLNGKQVIKDLFNRRNEIAHQSDRSHYNAKQNEITKSYVLESIEYVKNVVLTIHNIASSKKDD